MKGTDKIPLYAVFLLMSVVVFLGGFLIGRECGKKCAISSAEEKVKETIVYREHTSYRPTAVHTEEVGYSLPVLPSILFHTDSVEVVDTMYLPMERKVYEDSNYRAVVSGYRPSLDEITVTAPTIYRDRLRYVRPSRWGIGLQVGAGVLYDIPRDKFGVGIYAGVGLTYRFGIGRKDNSHRME